MKVKNTILFDASFDYVYDPLVIIIKKLVTEDILKKIDYDETKLKKHLTPT